MTDKGFIQKTLSCSPRTDYYQGTEETLQRETMFSESNRVSDVFRSLLPWFLALLLGVLTAITGSAIALFSDFLGDTRFGFCYGIFLADRNRCCGGSENVDFLLETRLRAERIGSVPSKDMDLSVRVFFSQSGWNMGNSEMNLYILEMAEAQVRASWPPLFHCLRQARRP
eukprot:s1049_g8.t1